MEAERRVVPAEPQHLGERRAVHDQSVVAVFGLGREGGRAEALPQPSEDVRTVHASGARAPGGLSNDG